MRSGTPVILVVEDNPASQMLVDAVLQGTGYLVRFAASAPKPSRASSSCVQISS